MRLSLSRPSRVRRSSSCLAESAASGLRMPHPDGMTSGQKNLVGLTILSGIVCLVTAWVAHNFRSRPFGDDADLATAASAAALSNVALVVAGCCLVGLCITSHVREMLRPTADVPVEERSASSNTE
jgi:hypothetical protein